MPWVLFSALYLINFCLMLFASAIPGLAVLGSVVDTWWTCLVLTGFAEVEFGVCQTDWWFGPMGLCGSESRCNGLF